MPKYYYEDNGNSGIMLPMLWQIFEKFEPAPPEYLARPRRGGAWCPEGARPLSVIL